MTNFTRQANIIINEDTKEKQPFPSINKAKQESLKLSKTGHSVTKLEYKKSELTNPSKQKSPFKRR